MAAHCQPSDGWTATLRRQPASNDAGQPEDGGTGAFEIICRDCGDDPGLEYSQVSAKLRRLRGPYPFRAGLGAYLRHLELHEQPTGITHRGREPMLADRR